jgi:hypothetical protein
MKLLPLLLLALATLFLGFSVTAATAALLTNTAVPCLAALLFAGAGRFLLYALKNNQQPPQ